MSEDTTIKELEFKMITKRRNVLVQFKTMQEILMKENAWFDGHGNLNVYSYNGLDHLTPSSFSNLGKMVEIPSHHSYPNWCIAKQYDDLFYQNCALRAIASGKMDPEDAVNLAKKSVLIPE